MCLRCTLAAFPEEFRSKGITELVERYQLNLLLISKKDYWPNLVVTDCVAYMDAENSPDIRARPRPPEPIEGEFVPALIFSSGTTGKIKCLMTTQRGLEETISTFVRRFNIDHNDSFLIFLPLSHNQQRALVYAGLYYGFGLFLTNASQVFTAFKEMQPTLCVAPPLFYEAIHNQFKDEVRKLGLASRLMFVLLSTLAHLMPIAGIRDRILQTCYGRIYASLGGRIRILWTGMAPIKRATIDFFARLRLPLYEAYGLTECSVIASNAPGANKRGSVGKLLVDGSVSLAEDGEIIVHQEALITRGYYECDGEDPALTFLTPNTVATGDIGRFDRDGFLYLIGRKKEIIITSQGIKVHPELIESQINECPIVDRTVVFGSGLPYLVALISIREKLSSAVESQIKRHIDKINANLPTPSRIVRYFVTTEQFTRENGFLTRNLKLDRRALFKRFRADLLGRKARSDSEEGEAESGPSYDASASEIEEVLGSIWAEVLRREKVGIHDNFFELGGDSILAIQVVAKANQAGLRISPKKIFQHQTIAELAVVAEAGVAGASARQGPVSGGLPLTPIQHWFFDNFSDSVHQFNQAVMLELFSPVDTALLKKAFLALLDHHDVLRMRFSGGGGGWSQAIREPEDLVSLSVLDLTLVREDELAAAIEQEAEGIQSSLDIEAGPILRVGLFELGAGRAQRLLIVIHHLAVDGVSWRILVEDLQTAIQQLMLGGPVKLPAKTTSIKDWAERLSEYAQSEGLKEEELEYWAEVCGESRALPRDYAGGANTYKSVETVSASLTAEQTRVLLQELPAVYKSEINDVLLTALARTFCGWTGTDSQLIELEGHGREEIVEEVDLSRTIGWFTTLFPVKLRVEQTATAAEALRAIKQQLRGLPGRGIGYGLLRYLTKDPVVRARLVPASQPEVSFNYLGQFDETVIEGAVLRIARESVGPAFSPQARRTHLIEINAAVGGGRLGINWSYSPQVHSKATVEGLAGRLMQELRELIRESGSGAESYTPADFPLARIDQQQLERIVSRQADVEDIYPLSPFQNQLLLYKIQSPKSQAYVGQLSCTFHGDLNTSAFKRAWQAAMGRHETLRTSFVWEDLDNPLQVVHRQVELPWQQYDWAHIPSEEQQERLNTFAREDRVRGFDLPKPPLMRFSFIRLAEDAHHFIWSHDHLLLDGWSLPLLLKDVFAFYEAFSRGEVLHLRPSPPFKDYIGWLQRQDLCEAEEFWRKAFDGFTAPTNMKLERMSSSQPAEESNGEQQTLLSPATTAALQSLARRHKLTLNTVVQGAWALLLSQYSGVRDVVFGVVVSGRPGDLTDADVRVGLFINTLPLRVHISPDESLPAWLEKLQSLQTEMLRYDYTPLAQIQRWSGTASPLFESILRFQNYPVDTTVREASGNFTIGDIRPVDIWHYPLSVVAVPGEQLSLTIGYDERRFDPATINSMSCGMETILEQMAVNPYQRLCHLSLTGRADQKLSL